jgi:hypothetical protein
MLRCRQVILIDCVIALKHRHRLMACDLHGCQGVHPCSPKVRCGGVARVVKNQIGQSHLSANSVEDLSNGLDGLPPPREYIRQPCPLRVKRNRQALQHLSQLLSDGNVAGIFRFRVRDS